MPDVTTGGWIVVVLAAVLTWLGFALLALAQERHAEQFFPAFQPASRQARVQTVIGFFAILLTLPLCIQAQGPGFGSLLWAMLLTAAAMAVALQLTWAPHVLKPIARLLKRLLG